MHYCSFLSKYLLLLLATVCGRWDLTASEVLSLCIAKPSIIHLFSTVTSIFKWRCTVERAYVPTGKKQLLVPLTCVLNFALIMAVWFLPPLSTCLWSAQSTLYLVQHSSYNLRRRSREGGKSPSISGNRRLYWKSMPFPCIYHCHSCSAYFWYSPCIVSSDCHVIKSLLITRAYFYAEISIRSLLQRPPDQ